MEIQKEEERGKTRYVLRNIVYRYARVDVVVWISCWWETVSSQSDQSVILPREPRETPFLAVGSVDR